MTFADALVPLLGQMPIAYAVNVQAHATEGTKSGAGSKFAVAQPMPVDAPVMTTDFMAILPGCLIAGI